MSAPSPANPSGKLQQALAIQRRREARRLLWMGILLLVLLGTVLADIFTGPSLLPFREVIDILMHPPFPALGFAHPDAADGLVTIVWDFRLPVALMAIVVGAALGLGGAEMQTLLDNPLASPYTLGLAAAAGLGAALGLHADIIGITIDPLISVPLGAFLMCMLAASVLFGIAMFRQVNAQTLILAGIALLFLFQSLMSMLQFMSSPELNQQIIFWLFGSLQRSSWWSPAITGTVTVVCTILLLADARKLTAVRAAWAWTWPSCGSRHSSWSRCSPPPPSASSASSASSAWWPRISPACWWARTSASSSRCPCCAAPSCCRLPRCCPRSSSPGRCSRSAWSRPSSACPSSSG